MIRVESKLKKGIELKLREKYDSLSVTVKASIWFTFCNLALKGISFITVPVFSRLLSTDEYGILSVLMSFEQMILTLATWEIALSAYQKGIFKFNDDVVGFTSSTLLLSNLITVCFFSVIFAFFSEFSDFTGYTVTDVLLLFFCMLLQPAYSCWLVRMRTEFKYRQAVFVTLLYSVASVVAPLIAILVIDATARIKFRATLLASIGVYLVFYLKDVKFISLYEKKQTLIKQWKFVILYQIPIVLHALSYTVLAQSDRIMISKLVGDAQAGFYSIAYSIANIVALFSNSVNQALVPWRFERLEKKQYDNIKKTTPYLLSGIAIMVLAFCFVSPEIMKILFSEEYYEAIWCIPPVALSVYYMFLHSMFVWVENYYEKTGYVAIVSVLCAIINILLNYMLIGVFGYIVCGYTTAFSYLLFCVGHYYFMKKACKKCGVRETIYDIKQIVLISLVTTITIGVTVLLYPYTIIRYVIFSIGVITCILKRKTIISFIKSFIKS